MPYNDEMKRMKGQVIDIRTRRERNQIETTEQAAIANRGLAEPSHLTAQEAPSTMMEILPDMDKIRGAHPILDFVDGVLMMAVAKYTFNAETREFEQETDIITSERNCFPFSPLELAKKGLRSKISHEEVDLQQRYSKRVIADFLSEGKTGNLLETTRLIRDRMKEAIDLQDESAYTFLAVWVVGTYLFPVFGTYPYIHFKGPRGVGKTTMLELLAQLCFNGELCSSLSAAAQFRYTHCCRATLLLDESERLRGRGSDEARTALLAGYKNGNPIARAVGNGKKGGIKRYEVYAPRAFASQREFEATLASRTVRINMTRSLRKLVKLNDATRESLRDDCFLAAMTCATGVSEVYSAMEIPEGILPVSGRDYDLFRPMMAIAATTGDADIVEQVTNFAMLSHRRQIVEFSESSPEHAYLEYLSEVVKDDCVYRGDVLLSGFKEFLAQYEVEIPGPINAKFQGEMLVSLGLVDRSNKKRSPDNKTRLYTLERKKLEQTARAYGVLNQQRPTSFWVGSA